jgi:dienelactone hydrolase
VDAAQHHYNLMRWSVHAVATILLIAAWVPRSAAADDFHREDLRIPFAAAGPRGLEAMLIRPQAGQRYPLALISHGSPRDPAERKAMSPYELYSQAMEFARRGFAALVVMRPGYGTSGGAENIGACGQRNYLAEAREATTDLQAAIQAVASRPDVSTDGMIAVGQSTGGFATVALTANPPAGLAAAISFAGGRGSRADNDVCQQDLLVSTFGTLGKSSRTPMLWIYAQNDLFFGPVLARRFHAAFIASGGQAAFVAAPAFGKDGHALFSSGIPVWAPMVDGFLREHRLGARQPLDLPKPVALAPPPQLKASGRQGFAAYLAADRHKAFAVSPKGAFAWRTRQRSADDARDATLRICAQYSSDCAIYAIDDELVGRGGPAAR